MSTVRSRQEPVRTFRGSRLCNASRAVEQGEKKFMHSKRLTGVAVAAVVALGTVVLPATSASEHQWYVPRPQRNRVGLASVQPQSPPTTAGTTIKTTSQMPDLVALGAVLTTAAVTAQDVCDTALVMPGTPVHETGIRACRPVLGWLLESRHAASIRSGSRHKAARTRCPNRSWQSSIATEQPSGPQIRRLRHQLSHELGRRVHLGAASADRFVHCPDADPLQRALVT